MDPLTGQHAIHSSEKSTKIKTVPVSNWQFEMELLPNCDLPPPTKIHEGIGGRRSTPPNAHHCDERRRNQSLLRALQLSQTRAREAEQMALEASISAELLSALFLNDSLRLRAARQWSMLLEVDISLLKQSVAAEEEQDSASATPWHLAFALCLGIAGAGLFVFSRRIF